MKDTANTAKILKVDPRRPDARIITRGAASLKRGGVVVFPTSGLYGLGADALNPEALTSIFAIKERDPAHPILVLIDHPGMLNRVARTVSAMALDLMERFWPGNLTLLLPARPGLPPGLTGDGDKIGVRLTLHPVARELVRALGGPITGTSANLSGRSGCAAIADLDAEVRLAVDLILDAGELAGGPGSTVVDATGEAPVILRPGRVSEREIEAAFAQFSRNQVDSPF